MLPTSRDSPGSPIVETWLANTGEFSGVTKPLVGSLTELCDTDHAAATPKPSSGCAIIENGTLTDSSKPCRLPPRPLVGSVRKPTVESLYGPVVGSGVVALV